MNDFEWIGLSGGEAIVRHRVHGHVYRFKVRSEGGAPTFLLTRMEAGEATDLAADHADEARSSAAGYFTCYAGSSTEAAPPEPPPRPGHRKAS